MKLNKSTPIKRMFGWVVFYPSPHAPFAYPTEVQYRTRALARAARKTTGVSQS